ncbi:hypothetical protein OPV22_021551 [Ensete ventricosum]|uniref:HMA domain-containing protein n=1 Tax=Ensete ventricosum TaxID=4639 RepID=A0AAV8QM93_ENSVE|nr:hypothetical protein OPV22_021551 [Ensete ventricosum]RWV95970.1 hypothetical protein GW17_00041356 [Ensete ventricosum]RWW46770.1 hypothetical protein BHE74_00047275 [Ensete ventricosum]RZS19738.1 hypothetical protein BHM03_00052193 [Ensete ventricosum]
MGGTLDYFSSLLGNGHNYKKKKKQFQTVELKVRMDYEGCELKVRNALTSTKGVQSVAVNRKQYKVTVRGFVEPHKVMKKVQSTGKKVEIWPYVLTTWLPTPMLPRPMTRRHSLSMSGMWRSLQPPAK